MVVAEAVDNSNMGFDLKASRVKGTSRQLFQREITKGNDSDEDFSIRPSVNRNQLGIAQLLIDSSLLSSMVGNILRINSSQASQFFQSLLCVPSGQDQDLVPVLIEHCTLDSLWPAGPKHWSPSLLVEALGEERRVEVAGADATVSLGCYSRYMQSNECETDDEPVYVFETLVDGEHDAIISSFTVPSCFTESSGCHRPIDHSDLLSAAGEDGLAFGLHRWLLFGPKHSGSNMHIDPLGTSAWNTLLLGRKLWVLFPPDTREGDIKSAETMLLAAQDNNNNNNINNNSDNHNIPPDSCAGGWFVNVLPTITTTTAATRLQFIQNEGETVYVPAGWHHIVLNLDETVCVTQNFASPCHYPQVASSLYTYDGFKTIITTTTTTTVCNRLINIYYNDLYYKLLTATNSRNTNSNTIIINNTGNEDDGEIVDDWRLAVEENWPDLKDYINNHCVHCNIITTNIITILSNRIVCVDCENIHKDKYEMITSEQVEKFYGIKIRNMSIDETPPFVLKYDSSGCNNKYYLHYHVRELEVFSGIKIRDCKQFNCKSGIFMSLK